MHPEHEPVNRATERLQQAFGDAPEVAIVLGSGLGPVAARAHATDAIAAVDLGLPASSVAGHAGRVLRGALGGTPVVFLSGRVHLYEGFSASDSVRSIRALHRWGVQVLLLTCSAGAVSSNLAPGDLVTISDHLNLLGATPLRGPAFGPTRFPDLSFAYDRGLRAALHEAAHAMGHELKEGVYAAMPGPSYETPAEIRMLRTMGADLVGMSTVPEVLAAAELELPVAAIAVVANLGAGMTGEALLHGDVTHMAGVAANRLADVIERAAPHLVARTRSPID